MKEKVLMKGNEAIGEGLILAGCRHYFGYPITPQTEIPEYLAKRFPEIGGVFVQAESEIASINMVYGAAAAGKRVMTSSSSPGISLKQEGISTLAAAELPCVIVNIGRGGPGVGTIQASQADYFQSTKGGGHGDYRLLVFAPNSVQELMDYTILAFDKADHYKTPVLILGDGVTGQMMEPVTLPDPIDPASLPKKTWSCSGCEGREPNIVTSLYLQAARCEAHNKDLQAKYAEISKNELRWEEIQTEDADVVIVAYGISSRISLSAVQKARAEGLKVGLLRPITLWPFPTAPIRALAEKGKKFLVVEQSAGQMVEDVRLAVAEKTEVAFYGRMGGILPDSQEILDTVRGMARNKG
ncbi:Ketoisovalerate oxidoreductase subunit VorB [uncultured delta proteobacterium]|uniref:Ketoisovalerate oxidoreductase subunit VorB n=1 Tax=uncultured delta proteobacterium TaxID=34034 RepID=A0A212JGP3_9DELT|nr:Ketoisovalerate oxidoreductase subunit VorB [uncultured delta proteobacterium]